jgi:hypothetical protein
VTPGRRFNRPEAEPALGDKNLREKNTFMRWPVVAAVFLMLSSGPVFADDVSDQMEEAKRLYENGRLADSVRELETAISGIRRRPSARLGSKMPPARPVGRPAGSRHGIWPSPVNTSSQTAEEKSRRN